MTKESDEQAIEGGRGSKDAKKKRRKKKRIRKRRQKKAEELSNAGEEDYQSVDDMSSKSKMVDGDEDEEKEGSENQGKETGEECRQGSSIERMRKEVGIREVELTRMLEKLSIEVRTDVKEALGEMRGQVELGRMLQEFRKEMKRDIEDGLEKTGKEAEVRMLEKLRWEVKRDIDAGLEETGRVVELRTSQKLRQEVKRDIEKSLVKTQRKVNKGREETIKRLSKMRDKWGKERTNLLARIENLEKELLKVKSKKEPKHV